MNKLHNQIALKYKQSVVLPEGKGKISPDTIRALLIDIAQLGYTLDGDVIRVLRTQSDADFKLFYRELLSILKKMVGANVKYRALFKNFPDDVPNDTEYLIQRLVGYVTNAYDLTPDNIMPLSCGHVIDPNLFDVNKFGACPICQMQVEELDSDDSQLKSEALTPMRVIKLATTDDVYQVFSNLLASKSSISETDKEVVEKLITSDVNALLHIPSTIVMKENLALVAGLLIKHTNACVEVLSNAVKTATDVLRIATHLSGGDVSLKEPTRFRLSKKERKAVMGLLDNVKFPLEDMMRYKMRWIRLGEVLHVGSHQKRFPNAYAAFDVVRNKPESVRSFGSKVEELVLAVKNSKRTGSAHDSLLNLLVKRPGEFARRLDFLLRTFKDSSRVVDAFNVVVDELPVPMLLTLLAFFENRTEVAEARYFIPKGKVAKMQIVEDTRSTLDRATITKVAKVINNSLVKRFSGRESLGNVYLDPALKTTIVPLQQRSASDSLVRVERGSRVTLPDTSVYRMFLYWKQIPGSGTVDVDLSAIAYDSDWNYKGVLSYYSLSNVGGSHSGDIRSAPKGAAEFIDITAKKALDNGMRYIVMTVNSFTGQDFTRFIAHAGVMGRNKSDSGYRKFDATTVQTKYDVVGDTRYNVPLILDLQTREFIWMDMALTAAAFDNAYSKGGNVRAMAKIAANMVNTRPNMYDLFMSHCMARAESVDTEFDPDKEYDLILDVEKAMDINDILSNWL